MTELAPSASRSARIEVARSSPSADHWLHGAGGAGTGHVVAAVHTRPCAAEREHRKIAAMTAANRADRRAGPKRRAVDDAQATPPLPAPALRGRESIDPQPAAAVDGERRDIAAVGDGRRGQTGARGKPLPPKRFPAAPLLPRLISNPARVPQPAIAPDHEQIAVLESIRQHDDVGATRKQRLAERQPAAKTPAVVPLTRPHPPVARDDVQMPVTGACAQRGERGHAYSPQPMRIQSIIARRSLPVVWRC